MGTKGQLQAIYSAGTAVWSSYDHLLGRYAPSSDFANGWVGKNFDYSSEFSIERNLHKNLVNAPSITQRVMQLHIVPLLMRTEPQRVLRTYLFRSFFPA